jgi:ADP-ribosylglycohydrolase
MACAISGAYLGIEAIPQDWQEKIEHGLLLAELARGLWSRRQQTIWEEASN